jgi:lipopolysaccharide/colanic/teichoic acid biosynthesis glycosyltransferase
MDSVTLATRAADLSPPDDMDAEPTAAPSPALPRPWSRPPLIRLRFQLPLLVFATAILPGLVLRLPGFWAVHALTSASNSFVLACVSSVVPGITSFAQVAPSVGAAYAVGLIGVLLVRLDYSRSFLLLSAASCLVVLAGLWLYYRRRSIATVYLVPGAAAPDSPRLKIEPLVAPTAELHRNALVAADLKADLSPAWQHFILNAALAGIPVHDCRTLAEAATGKVEIEHLSENTLGSVLPSLPYLKVKRLLDFLVALLVLPLALPLMAVVALAIRLDDGGPALFRQRRVGFRGRAFTVLKFRTMNVAPADPRLCPVEAAMTRDRDERVTRVGRILRRHRIDELPQLFNILKGEMSWIGPRPEAVPLARLYDSEIAFYGYRHMVRPGITGWAQVNQGHVVEVADIRDKLHYDFFYIKNFSAWLDGLIAARTVRILLFGKGAR